MYRLVSWRFGYKEYLKDLTNEGEIFTTRRANAWIADRPTADLWPELEREELSEAERMERLSVATLVPGLADGPGLEVRQ